MLPTIDLPPDQEAALSAKAQSQGISVELYAARVLEMDLANAPLPPLAV